MGGTTIYEGRVEICSNLIWGTVCDDLWGQPDSNVACGQLGFQNQGKVCSFTVPVVELRYMIVTAILRPMAVEHLD